MPKYEYTATDMTNRRMSDAADARDEADLRRILRSRGLVLLKAREVKEKHTSYRMKSNEVGEFSRQLASMLGSGITVVRAMEILTERDFKPAIVTIYRKLHKSLTQGMTVSEAMREQPRAFPGLLINMYASGEASGQLEHVAAKMADHYEKEHRLNSKVRSAMTYPVLLLVAMIVAVLAIFIFILPTFFEILEGIELPAITIVMMSISKFLQSYWLQVIIGVLLLIVVYQYLRTLPKIAYQIDKSKLYIPKIGALMRTIYTARFARTLSSLYTSGVSMLRALEITSTILSNRYLESQFQDVIRDIRNGELLSLSVGKVDGFDKKLSTTIMIGEESGRLDTMLESTAESFDYEAEMATGRMVQMIEPVMMMVMGVMIALVMGSVFLPVLELYSSADQLGAIIYYSGT